MNVSGVAAGVSAVTAEAGVAGEFVLDGMGMLE
jgi:hypothetical protein